MMSRRKRGKRRRIGASLLSRRNRRKRRFYYQLYYNRTSKETKNTNVQAKTWENSRRKRRKRRFYYPLSITNKLSIMEHRKTRKTRMGKLKLAVIKATYYVYHMDLNFQL